MESKTSLKQRLSRLFRPSAMLRTSGSSTTSGNIFSPSSSANTSSRRSLSATTATATDNIAHDPVFIPHDSLFLLPTNTTTLLDRSLSFSSSSRLLSLGCSGGCRPTKAAVDVVATTIKSTDSKKKESRARETGELYGTGEREGKTCLPASPSSPSKDHSCKKKKKKKKNNKGKATINNNKKKKLLTNPYGFSSSPDDDDASEFFCSDDEDVAETFFSSRSFSSDSSEFYKRPSSRKKNKNKDMKQSTTTTRTSSSSSRRRPPRRRRNNFRPVVSVEEEEEEESGIAVMKRSSDPYVDFRNSMVEMIVERQIFGTKDLERLLRSYLSLNSPSYHPVILGAFADISQVLFGH